MFWIPPEALFPKNRGHWKQFSSWEPNQQLKDKTTPDNRFPPDVEVKKGYSWSDQLGIVIAALVEASHEDLLRWTTEESHDRFFESILFDSCFTDSWSYHKSAHQTYRRSRREAGQLVRRRRWSWQGGRQYFVSQRSFSGSPCKDNRLLWDLELRIILQPPYLAPQWFHTSLMNKLMLWPRILN